MRVWRSLEEHQAEVYTKLQSNGQKNVFYALMRCLFLSFWVAFGSYFVSIWAIIGHIACI